METAIGKKLQKLDIDQLKKRKKKINDTNEKNKQ